MIIKNRLLSSLGQIYGLKELTSKFGVELLKQQISLGVLKIIPPERLLGFSGLVVFDSVEQNVTVTMLNGTPHFTFDDFGTPPILVSSLEEGFVEFSRLGFLESFRSANGISSNQNPFVLPNGIEYLGCKLINKNQTLHFLCKDNFQANELPAVRNLVESQENNEVKILLLTSSHEAVKAGLGSRIGRTLEVGELPSFGNSLRIPADLIYKSEYGFDFETVRRQLSRALIIDGKSGQVAFCGEIIWNEDRTDFIKYLSYLAVNKDKLISHGLVVSEILKKSSLSDGSKVVRDLKANFHRKVKRTFGEDSSEFALAKKVLPELTIKERGFSLLSSESIEIVLL